jgi:hypothetical protein
MAHQRQVVLSGDGQLVINTTWRLLADDPDRTARDVLVSDWKFAEHGGHAVKYGPDGYPYAIAGNDTRLERINVDKGSPVRSPEAGGILRFSGSGGLKREVIAHGFRNPYDFDFTPYGDIITFDSDTERDFLLPWYIPTRVYHVLPGAHHGWRLTGYTRSLGRPDYYPDTVEMLADMGRGSPTGVCCYRHTQFPEHYRGGMFLLDWTFGKVYYMPLVPEGSSYKKVKPEVFLEPTGTNGFAPTAIRVAPDPGHAGGRVQDRICRRRDATHPADRACQRNRPGVERPAAVGSVVDGEMDAAGREARGPGIRQGCPE